MLAVMVAAGFSAAGMHLKATKQSKVADVGVNHPAH